MEETQSQEAGFLARPLDRLAAFIVDFVVVLTPLMVLLISPLRSLAQEAMLLEDEKSLYFIYVAIFIFVFSLVFAYQYFMQSVWGKTLGQYCFNIKLVDLWGFKPPTKLQIVFRSLLWTLSLCTLGLAFLTLFTDSKRRSLIDRLSDTVVVNFGPRGIEGPSAIEKRSVQWATVFCFILVGFMCFSYVYRVYSLYQKHEFAINSFEQEGLLCSEIGEAQDEWSDKDHTKSRMNIAMSLYAAGEIGEDCLSRETEFMFRYGVQSPLNYLASSFIYSDDSDISNKYLTKVCESDEASAACQMSQVIDAWSEGDFKKVREAFAKIDVDENTYAALWAIRFYFKSMESSKVSKLISGVPKSRFLSEFLSLYKIKNKWVMGEHSQALSMLSFAEDHLKPASLIEMNAWMCSEQVFNSCDGKLSACANLDKEVAKRPNLLKEPKVALAYVEHKSCKGEPPLYAEFINPLVYQAYDSLSSWYPDSEEEQSLEFYMSSEDISAEVREFVRRGLIAKSHNRNTLRGYYDQWLELPDSMEKLKTGQRFFEKFEQFKMYRDALKVGQALELYPYKKNIAKKLLVLTYKLKGVDAAKQLYADFDVDGTLAEQRAPASLKYDQIVKEIQEAL